MSDDHDIIEQIDQLVEEEHALERRHAAALEPLSVDEKHRLRALEVHLDQLWDLLRQRRARRNAGLDPDEAAERDPDTVEGYRQ
ncbi:MAG: DUF2630 family protein [Acidimicrobiia bacterium]